MTQSQPGSSDQEVPLAAQIPLSSFTLPTFPPAASHLRSLTLTSDINLNDYQTKHLQLGNFEPSTTLPKSITHLTLELFSLGFPTPFLSELGKALPNLQSLTLFSCLVDGIDETSRRDATTFFETIAPNLRDLHIVDSFARAGFWKSIGGLFSPSTTSSTGLKILEVSYTYRGHYESDFLNRINGEEWSSFIHPSLLGLSLNFSPPLEEEGDVAMQAEKPEDQDELKANDGILPFASDGRASLAVRKRFEGMSGRKNGGTGGEGLKVLNLSMFALKPSEVGQIVYSCKAGGGVVGVTASVLLEPDWFETYVKDLGQEGAGAAIESLEVVGVPAAGSGDKLDGKEAEKLLMKSSKGMESLASACPKLERFEMSVLKSKEIGNAIWERENGKWVMRRETRLRG